MRDLLAKGLDAIDLARTYVSTTPASRRTASLFEQVERYVLFVGTPRSGSSIIGALLDAHPHAVIAHELAAMKYVFAGFDRQRLYHLLLRTARHNARQHRQAGDYVYHVPDQWQGRFDAIRVIGDKKAAGATMRLNAHPWLLDRLRRRVGVPLYLIHVVRNPFDNIATMARRAAESGRPPDLEAATAHYFTLCETVRSLEADAASTMIRLHHEAFVADPRRALHDLCITLKLHPMSDYLDACAGIVYTNPHRSRSTVTWPPALRRTIEQQMQAFSFLNAYTLDA